jgi:hypothetical protein
MTPWDLFLWIVAIGGGIAASFVLFMIGYALVILGIVVLDKKTP